MKYVQKLSQFFLYCTRTLYPFIACWFGAIFIAVGWNGESKGAGFFSCLFAGFAFAWAIDMAHARGMAKGESETAAKIATLLTTGESTEIRVDINYVSSGSK